MILKTFSELSFFFLDRPWLTLFCFPPKFPKSVCRPCCDALLGFVCDWASISQFSRLLSLHFEWTYVGKGHSMVISSMLICISFFNVTPSISLIVWKLKLYYICIHIFVCYVSAFVRLVYFAIVFIRLLLFDEYFDDISNKITNNVWSYKKCKLVLYRNFAYVWECEKT